MADHPELSLTDGGVILSLHVQPGAGRTEVVGRHGDALKVRVGAPPTANRANEAVVALIAKEFDVKESAVSITSGATNRQKRVKVEGVDEKAAIRTLDRLLDTGGRNPTR